MPNTNFGDMASITVVPLCPDNTINLISWSYSNHYSYLTDTADAEAITSVPLDTTTAIIIVFS